MLTGCFEHLYLLIRSQRITLDPEDSVATLRKLEAPGHHDRIVAIQAGGFDHGKGHVNSYDRDMSLEPNLTSYEVELPETLCPGLFVCVPVE